MHSRMQGHGGTRGQTAPSSAAGTGTHLLLPFSFVTHPAGPSTENVKLPATSLPRRMLLTAYVPRRKPVDTQSSSKINISFLLLELSHCAGHPGGTWPWEPARFGSKTPQKGRRCAHPTPVTLPKIPGMGSWVWGGQGKGLLLAPVPPSRGAGSPALVLPPCRHGAASWHHPGTDRSG